MPGLGEGCGRLRWVDQRSVAAADTIFCLGEKHHACMADKYPDAVDKLVITGNPRWDFLRPELRSLYAADAEAIRNTYAPFILINTNIGLVNSAKNSAKALIKSMASDGRIHLDQAEDRAFIDNILAFEHANFAAAIPLVQRLRREFPRHQIVLRPHPTENMEPYADKLAGLERVHLVREGPAAAWLNACDVLVHTSCTTATEAFALGKPAISFQTLTTPLHQYLLSGSLSLIGRSEEEVVALVHQVLAGKAGSERAAQEAVFNQFFAAQTGPLAAERIAHEVNKRAGSQTSRQTQWTPGWRFRRLWWPSKFQRRIFPDYSAADIAARMAQIAQVARLGQPPQVKRVGDGMFHVFPADMVHHPRSQRRFLPI
jgi:surface carbohydrate biosynthesis protein